MPKVGTRLLAVKVHTLPINLGEPEVDPPPDLVASVTKVVRAWRSPTKSPRFTFEEGEVGFLDAYGKNEATDRVFTAYLKGPFTVAHAGELAQLLARRVDSNHSIWVQLWNDSDGTEEVAFFEIILGKVERVKSP